MTSVTRTPVPLLDLEAQYRPIREEILAAIARVCDSQRFIMGPEVEGLERETRSVSRCARGGWGVLRYRRAAGRADGVGIGAGDEVVTSTFSFFATAGSIARVGATPVLVDIDPVTFNLDPAAVRSCPDSPNPCDHSGASLRIVRRHGSDHGRRSEARRGGNRGCGAGHWRHLQDAASGVDRHRRMLLVFSQQEPWRVRRRRASSRPTMRRWRRKFGSLRNHGAEPKYFHKRIGGNFRLDAMQAAVLRVKLPHLPRWTSFVRRMRRATTRSWRPPVFLIVTRPATPADRVHIFNQYIVRVPERDRVRGFLSERGIGTEIYYPVPFHLQECFSGLGHRRGDFPHAEAAADSTLALPIYGELSAGQQAAVVAALADAVRS